MKPLSPWGNLEFLVNRRKIPLICHTVTENVVHTVFEVLQFPE